MLVICLISTYGLFVKILTSYYFDIFFSNKERSNVCVTLPNLLMLLEDRSLLVQKRVVQAAGNIYRAGLQWISMTDLPSSDLSNVWQDLSNLKSHVINMIDNDNEG